MSLRRNSLRAGVALCAFVIATCSSMAFEAAIASNAGPSAAAPAFDPPAGVAPYFASSPFLQRLPDPPNVNSQSSAWIADLAQNGAFGLSDLKAYYTAAPNRYEIGFPVYFNHSGSDTPVRFHCTANFGGPRHPCNIEGMTVYVDDRESPQNGGWIPDGHDDAHWALIDEEAGYEYDTWETNWPPKDGVLTVAWGGRCALAGNGFTNPSYDGPRWNAGCKGDASATPLSVGILRAKDLIAAAKTGGVVPHALALVMGCPGKVDRLPPPFLGEGDGKCAGAAPEGSRLYLAMHDEEINALGAAPVTAAILRTLDEDHFGAFIIDASGKPSATFEINVESDRTYTAWGLPGPWLADFIPEARREGLPVYDTPLRGRAGVKLSLPSSITWDKVRFL